MKYEVLFINITRRYRSNKKNSGEVLGQHILAAFLEENGYAARVFNGYTDQIEAVLEKAIKYNGTKLIGIYCDYDNKSEVLEISRFIKYNYDVVVVIGGPQTIALNKEEILYANADLIVRGEGEISLLKICNYYFDGVGSFKSINNISYINKSGELIHNEIASPISNLDVIPFSKKEYSLNKTFRKGKVATILTGRGCPFACAFCYEGGNTKGYRHRSVENVMEEIDYILEVNDNLEYIIFADDTFTLDKKRLEKLCDELKKRRKKKDFVWYCEAHVSTLCKNPEIIPMMLSSGLVRIQIGIESGSQKVLNSYNKKITIEQILKTIEYCKKFKVPQVVTNFIIGGANESYETFNESLEFAKQLIGLSQGMLSVHSVYFAPYPNTAITKNPEKYEMKILDKNNTDTLFSMEDCVVETKNLKKEEIIKLKEIFDSEIDKKVEEELYDIPKEILYKHFKLTEKSITSSWAMKIYNHENIKEYMYLTSKNAFKKYSDLKEEEKKEYRPIKTISKIPSNIQISSINEKILNKATGKLKGRDFITAFSKEIDEDTLFRCFQELDEKYLIVFSKF